MASKKKIASLVRRCDFERLKKSGRRVRSGSWLVLTYLKNDCGHLRCGWTIPSRSAGAVVRNRLKRWGREYFQKLPPEEKEFGIDINVFIGGSSPKAMGKIGHNDFDQVLAKAWQQLLKYNR